MPLLQLIRGTTVATHYLVSAGRAASPNRHEPGQLNIFFSQSHVKTCPLQTRLTMGKRKRWMKTFSSVMQSIVGCITSTKNTSGTPFIKSWQNGRLSSTFPQSQHQDGLNGLLENRLKGYEVCLSDEIIYILAADPEEAAWYALELSNELDSYLLDVRLIDE